MPAPIYPSPRNTLDSVIAVLLMAMLAACLAFAADRGFRIAWTHAVPPIAALAGLALAWWRLRRCGQVRAAAAALALLQMSAFTLLGVVLAYAIASHPRPLWDAALAQSDRVLGFDWPTILAMLDGWPVAVWLLGLAYHSLPLQMVVAILALARAGRVATLRVAVTAAILSGFLTILVSAMMPADGNLFDPGGYRHLWPSIAWLERGLIAGLRDGTGRVLDLSQLMGIVSFPSFHATLAALFVWSARALPSGRWPLTAWALLTIVATPVFGGHYAIEVIVGLALAPPAIAAARAIADLLAARAPSTTRPARTAAEPATRAV